MGEMEKLRGKGRPAIWNIDEGRGTLIYTGRR